MVHAQPARMTKILPGVRHPSQKTCHTAKRSTTSHELVITDCRYFSAVGGLYATTKYLFSSLCGGRSASNGGGKRKNAPPPPQQTAIKNLLNALPAWVAGIVYGWLFQRHLVTVRSPRTQHFVL
jgi:hypothetical protein